MNYTGAITPIKVAYGCDSYSRMLDRALRDIRKSIEFTFENASFNESICKSNKTFSPDKIKDVEFYPPAVKMTFTDGTVTTAVAQEGDEYDQKTGMMVCIMKYIWQKVNYNTALDKWIKKDEAKKADQKAKAEAAAAEKIQRQKEQEKAAKLKAKKKEEAIEIQKEAYLRAMREMDARAFE